jgi:hypothetical protein
LRWNCCHWVYKFQYCIFSGALATNWALILLRQDLLWTVAILWKIIIINSWS